MNRLNKKILFAVILVLTLMILFSVFQKNSILLINNSGSVVPAAKIRVEDQLFVIPNFGHQQEEKFSFSVKKDSNYHLELYNSQGEIVLLKDFGYLTAGIGSKTKVIIEKNLEIKVE